MEPIFHPQLDADALKVGHGMRWRWRGHAGRMAPTSQQPVLGGCTHEPPMTVHDSSLCLTCEAGAYCSSGRLTAASDAAQPSPETWRFSTQQTHRTRHLKQPSVPKQRVCRHVVRRLCAGMRAGPQHSRLRLFSVVQVVFASRPNASGRQMLNEPQLLRECNRMAPQRGSRLAVKRLKCVAHVFGGDMWFDMALAQVRAPEAVTGT